MKWAPHLLADMYLYIYICGSVIPSTPRILNDARMHLYVVAAAVELLKPENRFAFIFPSYSICVSAFNYDKLFNFSESFSMLATKMHMHMCFYCIQNEQKLFHDIDGRWENLRFCWLIGSYILWSLSSPSSSFLFSFIAVCRSFITFIKWLQSVDQRHQHHQQQQQQKWRKIKHMLKHMCQWYCL